MIKCVKISMIVGKSMSIQTKKNRKKVTLNTLAEMKGKEPITMITAYDALFASLFDDEVEMILVGDSLNMSFYGKPDTISATMDQMIYHTKAVCKAAKHSFVVFDMPFGSYSTVELAIKNATEVYRQTCAQAVKIEGTKKMSSIVKALCDNGIAVIAHIGLMPQHVRSDGGYKVRGKDEEDTKALIEDAKELEEAGASILLIEGVKSSAAKQIVETVKIPTIGIGAGNATDGQVLVWSDAFGFFEEFKPKFVKRYADGAKMIKKALKEYVSEVKSRSFPDKDHSY